MVYVSLLTRSELSHIHARVGGCEWFSFAPSPGALKRGRLVKQPLCGRNTHVKGSV